MTMPHPNAGVKVSMNFNDRAFTEESVMDDVHRENIRMHLVPVEVFLNNMRTAGHTFTLQRNAVTLVRDPANWLTSHPPSRLSSRITIRNAQSW
jgi:hypothetical protein